ncbi:DUF998 domain-containing protein [Longispora sp. K20-0274]|uniref:DUF998 domain-containing protein n=1 Tax=Longispora sp. K20-0274 TaxID=3088255 RepID=UPI00399A08FB
MVVDRADSRGSVLVGAGAWALVVQYFVVLVVVRSAWSTPYSWARNAISDLGAAECGAFGGRQVCSPWHVAANVSWVITGLLIVVGAVLVRGAFPPGRLPRVGLALIAISGASFVVVGFSPEDTRAVTHTTAALATIALGEIALVVLGLALRGRRPLVGWTGITFGVVAMIALACMLARVGGHGLFGLWERIAAFPILIWLILCGTWLLGERLRAR